MELDKQIQELIENAPQDSSTATLIQAIAPALKQIAERLQHPQYYVLQTLDHGWVITALTNRVQPSVAKSVVYAYPTLADARAGTQDPNNPQIVALPIPVIHILFQMLAMKTVDGTVFFETPGNLKDGVEVTRANLQELLKEAYRKGQSPMQPPADLA
ncbi:MAG: hypothetical protein WBA57_15285 [Elainellaceae cyanobacterium]